TRRRSWPRTPSWAVPRWSPSVRRSTRLGRGSTTSPVGWPSAAGRSRPRRRSSMNASPRSSAEVTVVVGRSDPDAAGTCTVRRTAPMMVLDLLLAIQREHDAAIGFRYSCRVAMCGTCALRVDGRSALACQTPVPVDRDTVRLDPLAGLPVVRDVVVDTTPFWEEWARVTPYLVPRDDLTDPAVVAPDSEERAIIDPALDCIGCGACYSSCAVSAVSRD